MKPSDVLLTRALTTPKEMGYSLVALNIQEVADLSGPVKKLMNLELAAKKSRAGMWGVIRGDPRSYDDDM